MEELIDFIKKLEKKYPWPPPWHITTLKEYVDSAERYANSCNYSELMSLIDSIGSLTNKIIEYEFHPVLEIKDIYELTSIKENFFKKLSNILKEKCGCK